MNKKNKSEEGYNPWVELMITYGWGILIVLILIGTLTYFGVLPTSSFLPEPYKANAWCKDNPDKCVCEDIEAKAYSNDLTLCKQGTKGLQFRKKTQAELDIDDCNNNPREDENCKCEEEIFRANNKEFKKIDCFNKKCGILNESNCNICYDEICPYYNSILDEYMVCLKSRPKTDYELHPDDYVAETECKTTTKTNMTQIPLSNCGLEPEWVVDCVNITYFNETSCQTTYRLKNECEKGNIDWVEEEMFTDEQVECIISCENKFIDIYDVSNEDYLGYDQCLFSNCDKLSKTICREKIDAEKLINKDCSTLLRLLVIEEGCYFDNTLPRDMVNCEDLKQAFRQKGCEI